jgi:Co/Zn/Cd efflux system component
MSNSRRMPVRCHAAVLAYTYARKHADDPRFTFGTGKLGDLAGFTSGIILGIG